jgi:hypothetical protein
MKGITSVIFAILIGTIVSQAQIFSKERILNRTESEAQERVDQKVNNGIEKGFDAVEGMFSGKKKNKSDQGKEESDYQGQPNTFIGQMTMTIEAFKKGQLQEDESMSIQYALDEWHTAMRIDMGEEGVSRIIYELKEGTMVTLIDQAGMKQGVRMKMPDIDMDWEEESEEINPDVAITKTDQYKEISGYKCRLYIVEADGQQTEMWMTDELDANFYEMMSAMAGAGVGGNMPSMDETGLIEGFPIQMVVEDGKEKMIITYSDIQVGTFDKALFNTTGYQIMGF